MEEEQKIIENQNLQNSWVIWENYRLESIEQKTQNTNPDDIFIKSNYAITEFSDLQKFSLIWNNTDLSFPTKMFRDSKGQTSKFKIDGQIKSIQAFSLFKKNIMPTWEDPQNSKGSDLAYFLPVKNYQSDFDLANRIWQELTYTLISDQNPHDYFLNVNGIRLVDKSSQNQHKLRFEFWLDFKKQNNLDKLEKLTTKIVNVMQKLKIKVSNKDISYKDH